MREPLKLRPAVPDDSEVLLRWRNQPEVRANSRNTDAVGRAEHEAWLERTLADPARELLIVELGGSPMGQVRLDRLSARVFEVSVSLDAEAIGQGLGRAAIVAALERLRAASPGAVAVADVRANNARSLKAFEAAGFERVGDADVSGFVRLRSALG